MIQWAPFQTAPISNSDASYQAFDKSRPTIVWYPFIIWLGLFLGTTLGLWLFLWLKSKNWGNGRKSSDGKGNRGNPTSDDSSNSSNSSNGEQNRSGNPFGNGMLDGSSIQNGEGNPARRGRPAHRSWEISGFELSLLKPLRNRGKMHTDRIGSPHC
jgi:hypothetical protein